MEALTRNVVWKIGFESEASGLEPCWVVSWESLMVSEQELKKSTGVGLLKVGSCRRSGRRSLQEFKVSA